MNHNKWETVNLLSISAQWEARNFPVEWPQNKKTGKERLVKQNIEFERCIDFLVRMIDKYGEELLRELEEYKENNGQEKKEENEKKKEAAASWDKNFRAVALYMILRYFISANLLPIFRESHLF